MQGNRSYRRGRNELYLAPSIFNLGHPKRTRTRLISASDFVLEHAYDLPLEVLDNLRTTSTANYLRVGEESRIKFMEAQIMASNMINLEDKIRRSHPDWDYDIVSDENLNSFLGEYFEEERAKLSGSPVSPLTRGTIARYLETRVHAVELATSSHEAPHCGICLENYVNVDMIAKLSKCEHQFHDSCITEWLLKKNSCPMCRSLALELPMRGYPDWVNDLGMLRAFLKRDCR